MITNRTRYLAPNVSFWIFSVLNFYGLQWFLTCALSKDGKNHPISQSKSRKICKKGDTSSKISTTTRNYRIMINLPFPSVTRLKADIFSSQLGNHFWALLGSKSLNICAQHQYLSHLMLKHKIPIFNSKKFNPSVLPCCHKLLAI